MSTSHNSVSANETAARPQTIKAQDAFRTGPQAQTDTPQALVEYGEYLGRCIAMADGEPATGQTGKKRKWTSA